MYQLDDLRESSLRWRLNGVGAVGGRRCEQDDRRAETLPRDSKEVLRGVAQRLEVAADELGHGLVEGFEAGCGEGEGVGKGEVRSPNLKTDRRAAARVVRHRWRRSRGWRRRRRRREGGV